MVQSKQVISTFGETKYSLFRKTRRSDDLSLRLPSLKLNENLIYRVDSIKFFEILIDDKQHLRYLKSKVSKGTGLLFQVSIFKIKHLSLTIYYSYIYCYFNYGNVAFGGANRTNFKKT